MPPALHGDREAGSEGTTALPLSSAKTGRLDFVLLSISIATLAFLAIWRHVLAYAAGTETRYFEASAPDIRIFLALLLDVIGVAAVLFLSFHLSGHKRRILRIAAAIVIAFFTVFALWQVQIVAQSLLLRLATRRAVLILINAAPWIFFLFLLIRYRVLAKRALRAFFLILAPLFPLLALNGAWHYLTTNDATMQGKPAGMLPVKQSSSRVIWIIFDELDNRILTEARPAGLQLPEFDRLAARALRGNHVKSPAHETLEAIPSLLLGKVVADEKSTWADPLLRFQGSSSWVEFRSQSSLFTKARSLGFNAGASGWHHPYCRIMGTDLSDCGWSSSGYPFLFVENKLRTRPLYFQAAYLLAWQARSFPFLPKSLSSPTPGPPDEERLLRDAHINIFSTVFGDALRMLQNRDLNLVFVHMSIPHPPGIWNSADGRFTDGPADYIDNLKLADLTLLRVRRTLEKMGNWDSATVLVSADHPYRPELWSLSPFWTPRMAKVTRSRWQPYIPFLLKLPGQQRGIAYDHEFNSVISADLLLELLEGRLQSIDDVIRYLDKR